MRGGHIHAVTLCALVYMISRILAHEVDVGLKFDMSVDDRVWYREKYT
jgi:hypothetical protein